MAVDTPIQRASYAADPAKSRGRLHVEPEDATRNAFRRDCDRIIHSTAFRRLKHKTQVFVFHEGDHYRTRLTHTLEVTQIARALARALGLDEDLAEALALAHDLGHPPFGHAGERALNDCLSESGGFDHNAQALRVVTALEKRYADFDGLNLTWETLEGLVKHNGPLVDREGRPIGRYAAQGVPEAIRRYGATQDLMLWSRPSAEAQVAAIADDIAYDAHDIDDGLRADLFTLDDLAGLPLVSDLLFDLQSRYPALDPARAGHELVRRVIARMIEDVVAESRRLLNAFAGASIEDVRGAGYPVIAFSTPMAQSDAAIKDFLQSHMYRHPRVAGTMDKAGTIVRDLFGRFSVHPTDMPGEWREGLDQSDAAERLLRIADFIAGMTDRYALIEHARHFEQTPDLR